MAFDAGIVHQDVDRAELLDGRVQRVAVTSLFLLTSASTAMAWPPMALIFFRPLRHPPLFFCH